MGAASVQALARGLVHVVLVYPHQRLANSAVSPVLQRKWGPDRCSHLPGTQLWGSDVDTLHRPPGRLFPRQSAVGSHLSEPLTCPPASL